MDSTYLGTEASLDGGGGAGRGKESDVEATSGV